MAKRSGTHTISLRMPEATWRALSKVAVATDRSAAQVIRQAIRDLIDAESAR